MNMLHMLFPILKMHANLKSFYFKRMNRKHILKSMEYLYKNSRHASTEDQVLEWLATVVCVNSVGLCGHDHLSHIGTMGTIVKVYTRFDGSLHVSSVRKRMSGSMNWNSYARIGISQVFS